MFNRKLLCHKCVFEISEGAMIGDTPRYPFAFLVHNNTGYHTFTCPSGHKNHIMIQAEEFEILFYLALDMFAKGDYDAAVLRFYSALERFEEFIARTQLVRLDQEPQKAKEIFISVGKLSERRYGFYLGLEALCNSIFESHLIQMKKKEREEITNIRNNIAHNGFIPTLDEATPPCENIFSFILNWVHSARKNFPELITKMIISRNLDRAANHYEKHQDPITTMSFDGPLNMSLDDLEKPFSYYIEKATEERLQYSRDLFYGPFDLISDRDA